MICTSEPNNRYRQCIIFDGFEDLRYAKQERCAYGVGSRSKYIDAKMKSLLCLNALCA